MVHLAHTARMALNARKAYPSSHRRSLLCGLSLSVSLLFAVAAFASEPFQSKSLKPIPSAVAEKMAKGAKPYGQPAEAARFALRKRLPEGATQLPIERYFAAIDHMKKMPSYSTALGSHQPAGAAFERSLEPQHDIATWQPLGPGNIGGRTRALIVDPRNAQILYSGAAGGGVWKSVNAGGMWRPVGDKLANLAVNALAIDPSDSRTLYAGTGEGFFNIDAIRGAGIFKTTDAGTTWALLAATAEPNFHFVNDLVVSSRNRNRVYAATQSGVWRSLDGGTSWTRTFTPTNVDGCTDLALRTDKTTDVLFATCGNFTQGAIYRNSKAEGPGGWTRVLTEAPMGRVSLAIAPSNQDVIYALAASLQAGNNQFGLLGVFRSTNGGGTWTAQVRSNSPKRLNRLLLTNPVIASLVDCEFADQNSFLNQGWYDNVIAVDPKDPNRVWTGGIDLFRSDDAGKNWGVVSYWWARDATSTSPSYAHADQHAIVFHPAYNGTTNQIVYVANDGGIFRSTNARADKATGLGVCDPNVGKVVWRSLNNNYSATQFYHGTVYPNGTTYLGGTQDNGTIRGTDALGRNRWSEINGGDGGYVAVDPTNTSVLYVENTGLSIAKSTDGGATFDDVTGDIEDTGFNFIAPFAMDPSAPNTLWTGGFFIWRTTDAAASWQRASAVVAGPDASVVSALAIAPSDSRRVLVGLTEGFIHRNETALTSTGNTDWAVVQPREGWVSSLAHDPVSPNVAYATYSTFGGAHVWKTLDGGASWTPIDGLGATALPDVPVHSIVVEPEETNVLYIGTDVGVFISNDGGLNWMVENTGFPAVVTEQLVLQHDAAGERLYAFTHGRGAWKVTVLP